MLFRCWCWRFFWSSPSLTRPFVATPAAIAALRSENDVRISDRLVWYELIPVRKDPAGEDIKPTTGLLFVPGARVDSRAYAQVLRPLAEAGYLVAVLKEPFGFSLLDADQGRKVLDVHPEITYWAVGGHSLGGTTAASLADQDERVKGLVLFASYPADTLERTDLKAVSISGAADGLATPADIEASKEASARHVLCRDQRRRAQLIRGLRRAVGGRDSDGRSIRCTDRDQHGGRGAARVARAAATATAQKK